MSGFNLSYWPESETVPSEKGSTGSESDQEITGSVQDEPHLSISESYSSKVHGSGKWLLDDGPEPQTGKLSTPISQELKSFLSFLSGRQVQTYWRDKFTGDGVRRVYSGVKRSNQIIGVANSQPIPLSETTESLEPRSIFEVVGQLAKLFFRFRTVSKTHKLDFVLSPLRQAQTGVIEGKLALASVSVERFESQRKAFLKTTASNGPKPRLLGTRQIEKQTTESCLSKLQ